MDKVRAEEKRIEDLVIYLPKMLSGRELQDKLA